MLSLANNYGVQRDQAVGGEAERVDLDPSRSRVGHEQVAEARRRPGRARPRSSTGPPRHPSSSRAAGQLVGHLRRLPGGERGQADGDVGEGFGGRSAEPERARSGRRPGRGARRPPGRPRPGHGLDQVAGRADGVERVEGLVELGRGARCRGGRRRSRSCAARRRRGSSPRPGRRVRRAPRAAWARSAQARRAGVAIPSRSSSVFGLVFVVRTGHAGRAPPQSAAPVAGGGPVTGRGRRRAARRPLRPPRAGRRPPRSRRRAARAGPRHASSPIPPTPRTTGTPGTAAVPQRPRTRSTASGSCRAYAGDEVDAAGRRPRRGRPGRAPGRAARCRPGCAGRSAAAAGSASVSWVAAVSSGTRARRPRRSSSSSRPGSGLRGDHTDARRRGAAGHG